MIDPLRSKVAAIKNARKLMKDREKTRLDYAAYLQRCAELQAKHDEQLRARYKKLLVPYTDLNGVGSGSQIRPQVHLALVVELPISHDLRQLGHLAHEKRQLKADHGHESARHEHEQHGQREQRIRAAAAATATLDEVIEGADLFLGLSGPSSTP